MDINSYISSGVIESYVLGLATIEESLELEEYILRSAIIKDAVRGFEQMLENQTMHHAVAPPPTLKYKLMNALRQEGKW